MARRALEQLADLLGTVDHDALERGTPCTEWTVGDLVTHVLAAPSRFARLSRGESVDWSAPGPPAADDPARAFRSHTEELLTAWREVGGPKQPVLDWQCAELAVHTWDLATALGRSTGDLDPQVAERGLAFMETNLSDEGRGRGFGPPQSAPDDADAYERIAAIAGRSVRATGS